MEQVHGDPSSVSTPTKGFKDAVKDLFRRFSDPQTDPSRAVPFFLNRLTVASQVRFLMFTELLDLTPAKFDISPYLESPGDMKQGELFDSSRENMNMVVSSLFKWPEDQTPEETQKMMKFGREIYSFVLTKLLQKSLSTKNTEFSRSLRGITWSVMAKDIDKTLGPQGQKPLSPEWRDKMRKIIFSEKPDMKVVGEELKKFESGNEEVFLKQE